MSGDVNETCNYGFRNSQKYRSNTCSIDPRVPREWKNQNVLDGFSIFGRFFFAFKEKNSPNFSLHILSCFRENFRKNVTYCRKLF